MLKPRKLLTLKVTPSRRERDLSFVPEVYLFCGSLVQLIGSTCGGKEGGAVAAPRVGVPSAGRDSNAVSSSSGVLSICRVHVIA